jgi:hypothetical protein
MFSSSFDVVVVVRCCHLVACLHCHCLLLSFVVVVFVCCCGSLLSFVVVIVVCCCRRCRSLLSSSLFSLPLVVVIVVIFLVPLPFDCYVSLDKGVEAEVNEYYEFLSLLDNAAATATTATKEAPTATDILPLTIKRHYRAPPKDCNVAVMEAVALHQLQPKYVMDVRELKMHLS